MKEREKRWETLLARAREDGPDPVDVTDRVLQRIATVDARPRWLPPNGLQRPLLAAAGVSLAAAAVVAMLAYPYYDALLDPLLGLMHGEVLPR